MRVIFLDFDGVLNSQASFVEYSRRKKKLNLKTPTNHTLCGVCCSNLQIILDKCPDVKIIISSTWRQKFTMRKLKSILRKYGIDHTRVIDRTPAHFGYRGRGREIQEWLSDHEDVTDFVILDDSSDMDPHMDCLVQTEWWVGLTLHHVNQVLERFGAIKIEQDT